MAQQPVQIKSNVQNNDNDDNYISNNKEAIKFIIKNLQSKFDEERAKKLFRFYVLDETNDKMLASDVRKLMFDILAAAKYPIIVPDEILDEILHQLSLNDRSFISWIEFKSFFVFLQEKPLYKLLQIAVTIFQQQQLGSARLFTISPKDNKDIQNPSYDRALFRQKIVELIPQATSVFIYFLGGGSLLALALGTFNLMQLNTAQFSDIIIDGISYMIEMQPFDMKVDIFPPIAHAGGIKSKVARKIADTYIITKQWDEKNLNVMSTTKQFAKQVSEKWNQMDEKFKIKEMANSLTTTTSSYLRDVDETLHVSQSAKNIDEKYGITKTIQSTVDKLQANPTIQTITQKIEKFANSTFQNVKQIQQETSQLVEEKQFNNIENEKEGSNTQSGDKNKNINTNNAIINNNNKNNKNSNISSNYNNSRYRISDVDDDNEDDNENNIIQQKNTKNRTAQLLATV